MSIEVLESNLSAVGVDGPNATCLYHNCMDYVDYVDFIEDYIYPKSFEWFFLVIHLAVFIIGIVGNLLVCYAVYKNETMRTVTNYFIVNLAIADFLVILFCLPPTVLWDITETWFLGSIFCKLIIYFQVSFNFINLIFTLYSDILITNFKNSWSYC